ncbi:hypothetical protein [Peijinzhouia sedimentorum]
MNRVIFFSIFFLLLFCNNVFSQGTFKVGYIITNQYDTIPGLVKYSTNLSNYSSCTFKNDRGEVEYSPNQIVGFGYSNDKFFVSEIQDDSFVEALVIGELSLYKSKFKFHLKKDDKIYTLESNNEFISVDRTFIKRERNNWKGIIAYLVSDCLTDISDIITNLRFDERSITKLVIKYNNCKGSSFKAFKINKPWIRLEYGIVAGLAESTVQVEHDVRDYSYLEESYTSIDPTIGLVFSMTYPRLTEKIAFQIGVNHISSNYKGLVVVNRPTITSPLEYHTTYLSTERLIFPLSLKYSFHESKFGFYLQGGGNYIYQLNYSTLHLYESVRDNIVTTGNESIAFEVRKRQMGYWGEIGSQKAFNNFSGSLGIRYNFLSNISQSPNTEAINSLISINITFVRK